MTKTLLAAAVLSAALAAPAAAQVQTCVWPNRCAASVRLPVLEWLVQVQPCVWPRICRVQA